MNKYSEAIFNFLYMTFFTRKTFFIMYKIFDKD